jgi:two-component system, OmpR family, phosphate regulon response regulator PhoB
MVTPSVLVIEDDLSLRTLFRAALMGAGYAVTAVGDGIDALRHIESNPAPQAVVLDLALPRLSGFDIGRDLKARPETANIPIIVVTGTGVRDGELDSLEVDCVFRKPISADALVSAVDNCLRRFRTDPV